MTVNIDCNDINLLSTLISVVIGVIATWVFAWLYYKRAGDELKREAMKLRKATHLILYCHIYPDAKVGPIYDEDGLISGLTVDMQASM